VGVSGLAPLTRCRGGTLYPTLPFRIALQPLSRLAPPLARCSRITLLLNVIPPYYTCFLKYAAFQCFPLTYCCRRCAPGCFGAGNDGAPPAGGTCGHRLGAPLGDL